MTDTMQSWLIDVFIFDMDGTLVDSDLDFSQIRREACVPDNTPILEYINSAEGQKKERAREVLRKHEARAARTCHLFPDTRKVLQSLKATGHKIAILTRNSRRSARLVVERFALGVDCLVTRNDAPPKPSPAPLHIIAQELNTHPSRMLMVGDYLFDLQAARAAGARSALVRTPRTESFCHRADIKFDNLAEILQHQKLFANNNDLRN